MASLAKAQLGCGATAFQYGRRVANLDFEKLVEDFYLPLYRFALSLSRKESDAADLVQQTFFLWASKGHQLRDAAKVKTWLFTSLYREFLGRKRHQDRFVESEVTEAALEQQIPASIVSELDGDIVLQALSHWRKCIAHRSPCFICSSFPIKKSRRPSVCRSAP